ncbi:phosphotransferase [Gallaecimonas kandeliae]|uniref:aminoglycoside phosphotransferase family protein n=1 Tax=Gallaecimonas kandeliae TaxID=3029055 RepID=UPI002649A77E|nr:phosphotransferase [Gallaecimonas kandeliae]WKE66143.1 phosphotransferase [Gallaecimonas kandeliae]
MRQAPIPTLQDWACGQLGLKGCPFTPLAGDAGSRRYWRLGGGDDSAILVSYPQGEQAAMAAFTRIAKALAEAGVLVPEPLAATDNAMLLPDLGDRLLSGLAPSERGPWYRKAVALLAKVQGLTLELPQAGMAFVQRKRDLFQDWYLGRHLGVELAPGRLDGVFALLFDNFFAQPLVPAHRDYHGRNLHLVGQELAVIDFQDMQLLPLAYDAVSLIRDSYVALSLEEEEALIAQAFAQQAKTGDQAQFRRWLDLTGVLRQLKVLGIFCRLHYQDGKSGYLQDLVPTRDKLLRVARGYPELAPLVALLDANS